MALFMPAGVVRVKLRESSEKELHRVFDEAAVAVVAISRSHAVGLSVLEQKHFASTRVRQRVGVVSPPFLAP